MNFTPLDNTGRVEGFCLVKSVEKKTSSKGDTYLDFTLSDKDGEVNAKLWRYDPYEHGEYKPNDIVKVRGSLLQYNGSDQLRIDRIRTALPEDNINMEELVKTASYSSEDMYGEIRMTVLKGSSPQFTRITGLLCCTGRQHLSFTTQCGADF